MNEQVEQIRADQCRQWRAGNRVPVEMYLEQHPDLRIREELAVDLIYSEILLREELGETLQREEYFKRFPQYAPLLWRQLQLHEALRDASLPAVSSAPARRPAAEPTAGPSDGFPPTLPETGARGAAGDFPAIPGFAILGLLGSGGRGVVYRARQLSLDRVVALKMIRHDEDLADPDSRCLFQREAEAVARLEHVNVVRVYELGEHAGRPYIVMELAEGGSLADRLAGGPLPPREAAALVEVLARAVHFAHGQGLVHRDLKPANVLLTRDQVPKVADFGLAKRLGGGESLFPSGTIVGTAAYIAPEQAAGRTKEVGPVADVYGLGAILYECLTGRPPFRGPTWWDTLNQVRTQEPTAPRRLRREVPRDLETICLKCLQKDPKERYASAEELAGRLRLFLEGKPIPDRPRPWPARLWRVIRPHLRTSAAAAVLFGLLVAVAVLVSRRPDPGQARKEIRDRVERGLPYVFEGHEPLPGPFRWVVGDADLAQANPAKGYFTVQTWNPVLLELVADPWCDSYRFSAEVRHEAGMGNSLPGIYFGCREGRTPQGDWQSSFFALTLADEGLVAKSRSGPNGEALSRVLMEYCLWETTPKKLVQATTPLSRPKEFRPALSEPGRPAPWRRLEVEVTPQGVTAYWGLRPEGRDPVAEVPTADLVKRMTFAKKVNPGFAGLPSDFRPRSGLGLYILKGKVSFRRIVLQPLAGRRGQD